MSILRGVGSDVAIAVRRLRKSAGFTFVCVATLALGIGGNTAVFTLIDRVHAEAAAGAAAGRAVPARRHRRLLRNSGLQGSFSLFSYDLYHASARGAHRSSLSWRLSRRTSRPITIGRADPGAAPETLGGAFVSGNYFQLFELSPAAGRLLQPADDRPEAPAVAVISHRAWTERFQGRADVIGSPVTLNGVPATIVGVAPHGFYGDTLRPDPADIWMSARQRAAAAAGEPPARGQGLALALCHRPAPAGHPTGTARRRVCSTRSSSGWDRRSTSRRTIAARIPRQYVTSDLGRRRREQHPRGRSRRRSRLLQAIAGGGAPHRLRQPRQPAARRAA